MEPRLKLSKTSSNPSVDTTEYRSHVGSLKYLLHTRPDLSSAMGYASRLGLWYERREKEELVLANLIR
jgi:hypothetical protein